MFVVLEGLDGAGTTTQSHRLAERLAANGHPAVVTREPSDGPIGVSIRQALRGRLVGPGGTQVPAGVLALLFAADRLDHLTAEIEPALGRGDVVICDRYVLSSIAYQGVELGSDWVGAVNARARRPDLTILVDVPVRTCMERMAARGGERELFERADFLDRVRAAYLRLADDHGGVERVDGAASVDVVSDSVWSLVSPRLRPTV